MIAPTYNQIKTRKTAPARRRPRSRLQTSYTVQTPERERATRSRRERSPATLRRCRRPRPERRRTAGEGHDQPDQNEQRSERAEFDHRQKPKDGFEDGDYPRPSEMKRKTIVASQKVSSSDFDPAVPYTCENARSSPGGRDSSPRGDRARRSPSRPGDSSRRVPSPRAAVGRRASTRRSRRPSAGSRAPRRRSMPQPQREQHEWDEREEPVEGDSGRKQRQLLGLCDGEESRSELTSVAEIDHGRLDVRNGQIAGGTLSARERVQTRFASVASRISPTSASVLNVVPP